ncbi:hypothetical protein [Streptomyces sp. AJS327]|uniref:hypothetical protein n=1 Tax=Streptomyces sp. AJS327 TaxID=2545265 RepID=UPI002155B084|nr:hypothetical protein [Streptomyces sp. AJS327]
MTDPRYADAVAEPAVIRGGQWLTVRDCKRVLVVAHTMTYAQRLRDAFELLARDLRIQVTFTVAPHPFGGGVHRYLRHLGISVVPWQQVVHKPFDLALAAGSRGIEQIDAPVIRLPHGAGHIKPLRQDDITPTASTRPAGMLSRTQLTHDGKVTPAAIGLSHRRDLDELARSCPEALPVATVLGDPAHDRLTAGLPRRAEFRRALGLRPGERLLVVSSTWGPTSTFGRLDALLPQLLDHLTAPYRVLVLTHPNIWAGHGGWQVNAWLRDCAQRGVSVLPPTSDWEAPLIGADVLLGDHGSLTAYGTLTDVPVLLTHSPRRAMTPSSPAAALARTAPVLSPGRPLMEQLKYAAREFRSGQYAEVAESLTSEPGRFHRRMRALMYRMLDLGEPAFPAQPPDLPLPPALLEPLPHPHGPANKRPEDTAHELVTRPGASPCDSEEFDQSRSA